MANAGGMPAYNFRPEFKDEPAKIKTHSAIRARLFNSTYFRAAEPGAPGNNISITLVQVGNTSQKRTGTLFVTNHNTKVDESIKIEGTSQVKPEFIYCNELQYNESISLKILTPHTARAVYSISLQIAPNGVIQEETTDLGPVDLRDLFYGPKGISIKLDLQHSRLTPGDTVILLPRIQKYTLKWTSVSETGDDGTTTTVEGWDIDDLRTQVGNKPESWVQMPRRTMSGPKDPPINPPFDYQDDGYDAPVLKPFDTEWLDGGDGLPSNPDGQKTGPVRSIIHLNYSETDNGQLGLVNVIYEWSGENHLVGEWVNLFS